jgi:DMSO/TMAO reductase YedYZ molybdopterin-dependent catalytic subunit
VDTLFEDVELLGAYTMVHSYGGYTTNLAVEDISDGKAWVVYAYDGQPLEPEHGGPARLLVPHLYFWKSAKWVNRIDVIDDYELGFWETLGYHDRGDPWREQRYQGD